MVSVGGAPTPTHPSTLGGRRSPSIINCSSSPGKYTLQSEYLRLPPLLCIAFLRSYAGAGCCSTWGRPCSDGGISGVAAAVSMSMSMCRVCVAVATLVTQLLAATRVLEAAGAADTGAVAAADLATAVAALAAVDCDAASEANRFIQARWGVVGYTCRLGGGAQQSHSQSSWAVTLPAASASLQQSQQFAQRGWSH